MGRNFQIPLTITGQNYKARNLNRIAAMSDHALRYLFAGLFAGSTPQGTIDYRAPYFLWDSFMVEPVGGNMDVRVRPGVAFDAQPLSYGLDPVAVPGITNDLPISPIELENEVLFSVDPVTAGGGRQRKDLICIRSNAAPANPESLVVVQRVGTLPGGAPDVQVQNGVFLTAIDRALDSRVEAINAGDLPTMPMVYIKGAEASGWDPNPGGVPFAGNIANAPGLPVGYTAVAVITVDSSTTEIKVEHVADKRRLVGPHGFVHGWASIAVEHDVSDTSGLGTMSARTLPVQSVTLKALSVPPGMRMAIIAQPQVIYPGISIVVTAGEAMHIDAVPTITPVARMGTNAHQDIDWDIGPGDNAGPYGGGFAESLPILRMTGAMLTSETLGVRTASTAGDEQLRQSLISAHDIASPALVGSTRTIPGWDERFAVIFARALTMGPWWPNVVPFNDPVEARIQPHRLSKYDYMVDIRVAY